MRQTAYTMAVLRDAPYLYAPLDENAAAEGWADRSGNGRNATNQNGCTHGFPPIAPGLGRSTNIADWLQFPAIPAADLASGGSFTVEVWLMPTSNATSSSSFTYWASWAATQQRWSLSYGIGSDFHSNYANNTQAGNSGPGIICVAGMPYHLVATVDANIAMTFYVNGACMGGPQGINTAGRTGSAGTHRLGRNPDTFWGATLGLYSNFAYYSGRALSSDRIRHHYQLGRGSYRTRQMRRSA